MKISVKKILGNSLSTKAMVSFRFTWWESQFYRIFLNSIRNWRLQAGSKQVVHEFPTADMILRPKRAMGNNVSMNFTSDVHTKLPIINDLLDKELTMMLFSSLLKPRNSFRSYKSLSIIRLSAIFLRRFFNTSISRIWNLTFILEFRPLESKLQYFIGFP